MMSIGFFNALFVLFVITQVLFICVVLLDIYEDRDKDNIPTLTIGRLVEYWCLSLTIIFPVIIIFEYIFNKIENYRVFNKSLNLDLKDFKKGLKK